MHRLEARGLGYLHPARAALAGDESGGNVGDALEEGRAGPHGEIVGPRLHAEGAGHPAAAGGQIDDLHTGDLPHELQARAADLLGLEVAGLVVSDAKRRVVSGAGRLACLDRRRRHLACSARGSSEGTRSRTAFGTIRPVAHKEFAQV